MSKKPVIELKKIHLSKSLSEETPAYTAQIWVDGEKFCDVSNRGFGGCDEYHSCSYSEVQKLDELIKETYPKHDVSDMYKDGEKHEMDESLESLCHGLVWDNDFAKTVKRDLSSKPMFVRDGKIMSFKVKLKTIPEAKRPEFFRMLKEKNGIERLLNEMPFAEALSLFKEAADAG